MKLRTSYFNSTVLKKDITRFAPVWGLYTLFMLMVVFLLNENYSDAERFANSAGQIMIAMGIVLLRTGYVLASAKTVLEAYPVFLVLVLAAGGMNELAHLSGLLERETFNMFFISPYCAPSLPVYSLIQPLVPYPVSVLIYIVGFTAAAGIVLMLARLLHISAPAAHRPVEVSHLRLAHTGHS